MRIMYRAFQDMLLIYRDVVIAALVDGPFKVKAAHDSSAGSKQEGPSHAVKMHG